MDTTAWSADDADGVSSIVDADIDPRHQGPEQPKESEKTIDAWGPDLTLRGVLHDMTTPAATVRFLAQLMAEESSDARVQQVASQILNEAEYLINLCTDVLEGGRLEEIRVDEVASRIIERTRLVTDVEVDDDLQAASLTARPVSIDRLISNLLANALRAAGPQGRVRVAVRPHERGVTMAVGDSGPGFPSSAPDAMTGLSSNARRPRRALGLLIVDGIVRQYEGTIDIGRSDLGGAQVSIWMPAFPQRQGGIRI